MFDALRANQSSTIRPALRLPPSSHARRKIPISASSIEEDFFFWFWFWGREEEEEEERERKKKRVNETVCMYVKYRVSLNARMEDPQW